MVFVDKVEVRIIFPTQMPICHVSMLPKLVMEVMEEH